MIISVFDSVENIVGKGEIACTSNFSFSHNVFKRLLLQTHQKRSLRGNGLTHYQTTILDSSKLKEFADDNFKLYENGRELFKPVENTVGKGEIARYKQFLLFPQCFQKACFPEASKGVIVWECVKQLW